MNTRRKVIVSLTAFALACSAQAFAQADSKAAPAKKQPAPKIANSTGGTTPHETTSTVVDGNRVTIVYGRPFAKHPRTGEVRKVWGGLVPYGKVWRTGADEATLLITQQAIEIDGRTIPADVVLVGVGGKPNDEIARDAGLECARGVVVDAEARTSDPHVFAIGDVSHRPLPIYERMFGLESVPSALEQAKQAACAITGRAPPPAETPWNWSDQYDLKLQIAGLPFDADQVLVRGDPASGKFAVFHLKGDQVQAVEAINSPPEFMMGKQLIGNRKPVSQTKLADPSVSMKEVAA